MPHDLPPWHTGYQQSQRWLKAGLFDAMVGDLRALLRLLHARAEQPSAAIVDSRTLQSMPESGTRAGYDGAKRRKGSKLHMAVDTLGHLLALQVAPAHVQDRSRVSQLAADVQVVTGDAVGIVYVDQGYTGDQAAHDAEAHHLHLDVVKLPEAKSGIHRLKCITRSRNVKYGFAAARRPEASRWRWPHLSKPLTQ